MTEQPDTTGAPVNVEISYETAGDDEDAAKDTGATGLTENEEEASPSPTPESAVSANNNTNVASSSNFPYPVGDLTCYKSIRSPLDFFTLTFGWLVHNKSQVLSGITVALAQVPEAVSFSFVAGTCVLPTRWQYRVQKRRKDLRMKSFGS